MVSTEKKRPHGDDPLSSNTNLSLQPTLTNPSVGYMYSISSHLPAQPLRSKPRQVKNACTNCQKACKKCDDARPCFRCVKYGISEECIDSLRKERKKGIKRGPYKKRNGKDLTGSGFEQPDVSQQQGMPVGVPPLMGPYIAIPGYYGQAQVPKTGENGFYPPYLAPVPPSLSPPYGSIEGDHNAHLPRLYYPALLPYLYPYMVSPHDEQTPPNFMAFSMNHKPGGPSDLGSVGEWQGEDPSEMTDGSGSG